MRQAIADGATYVEIDLREIERRLAEAATQDNPYDDRLYHPDEFVKVVDIRRQLAGLPVGDAIETLLSNLKATKSNAELLLRGMR